MRAISIVRLALVLLVGPASLLIANKFDDDAFDKRNVPVQASAKGCDMHLLADLLNDAHGLGDHPRLIINTLNEGAELLFRTKDTVLAGPFHMNLQGNMDALRFFTTPDPDEAKAIAEKRDASLIVICNVPSQLRAYRGADHSLQGTFIQQLIGGKAPAWLAPIQAPQLGDLMLFQIQGTP